jgi:DNA-binding IclR family transcriptional regulator
MAKKACRDLLKILIFRLSMPETGISLAFLRTAMLQCGKVFVIIICLIDESCGFMIQSIERVSNILHCFDQDSLLGITQIAKRVGLSKSTTFGIVSTLTKLGFLEQDKDTGLYKLGLELFLLGNRVDAEGRNTISRELDALVETLGETINYVRRQGSNVIYLAKKESPHSMRISTTVGMSLPMYCSAVDKAILAYLPQDEQDAIINVTEFQNLTDNTLASAETLRSELKKIRSQGFALDSEELEYGLTCVAVPILNIQGYPVAAISCSGPSTRMTPEKIAVCQNELRQSAARLSRLIS